LRFLSKHVQAIFLVVGLVLLSGLLLQSQSGNQRVDSFLNSLPTLANIDLARSAVQNLRFTAAETRQLEGALKKPDYRAQIDRLLGTAKVPSPAPPPTSKDPAALKREQLSRIAGLNQRTRSEAQKLISVAAKLPSSLSVSMTVPRITSLSPTTIEPGMSLIIRGADLLPQGSVMFTFGSAVFKGSVEYWAGDFILVNLQGDIQGVGEQDGQVTVKKQNGRRADAAIHFVPIWEYDRVYSTRMTYSSNPYDPVVAFYNYVVRGISDWCSSYQIPYGSTTSTRLLNGYTVCAVSYDPHSDTYINRQYENVGVYLGSSHLPELTAGQICHSNLVDPKITCVVTIKGPHGVPYK
jgi:hypothetical protein